MSAETPLPHLRALASGLSPQGHVTVEIGDTTAYTPALGRVTIGRDVAQANDPAPALGALAHELGHALITRYTLFRAPLVERRIWWFALNAVEDPRVHLFLRRRFPGVGPWLRGLFDLHTPPLPGEIVSDLEGFLLAAAACDRHPEIPFLETLPAARTAFARTAAERAAYAATLPLSDLTPPEAIATRYCDEVVARLSAIAPPLPMPGEAEAGVRLSALLACDLFQTAIWPEVRGLMRLDTERVGAALQRDETLRREAEEAPPGTAKAAALARQALSQAAVGVPGLSAELNRLARRLLTAHWQRVSPAWADLPAAGPRPRRRRASALHMPFDPRTMTAIDAALSPDDAEFERPAGRVCRSNPAAHADFSAFAAAPAGRLVPRPSVRAARRSAPRDLAQGHRGTNRPRVDATHAAKGCKDRNPVARRFERQHAGRQGRRGDGRDADVRRGVVARRRRLLGSLRLSG